MSDNKWMAQGEEVKISVRPILCIVVQYTCFVKPQHEHQFLLLKIRHMHPCEGVNLSSKICRQCIHARPGFGKHSDVGIHKVIYY